MAVPAGYSTVNSGGSVFLYNNLQAPITNVNSANANAVNVLPQVIGYEPQSANFLSARQPGGIAWRQPNNVTFPQGNSTVTVGNASVSIIGGDFAVAAARMGYTKGAGVLITSNTNGTAAVTIDLTNTQVNTNSFWGDTTFATINVLVFENLNQIDGISNNNGLWYINGSVTNGAVLNLNTNGTYVAKPNGGTVVIHDPNGFTISAAACKILCTPTNGGVLSVAAYGA